MTRTIEYRLTVHLQPQNGDTVEGETDSPQERVEANTEDIVALLQEAGFSATLLPLSVIDDGSDPITLDVESL